MRSEVSEVLINRLRVAEIMMCSDRALASGAALGSSSATRARVADRVTADVSCSRGWEQGLT